MGRILHAIDGLPFPLLLADERLTVIPRGETLFVPNTGVKIVFFLKANLEMSIRGRPSVRIQSGDVLTVPPGVRQVYRALRPAEERLHLQRILLAPSVLAASGEGEAFLTDNFQDVHHLPKAMTPRHHELIARLNAEIDARGPGYRLMAGSFCLELAALAMRAVRENRGQAAAGEAAQPSPSSAVDAHVRRAKEVILESYEKPLTLEQIAWSVRLSREHLARIFHEATGSTVFDYLTLLRIDAAKAHLCATNLPVTEIAALVGFTSTSLFCRTFKRMLGQTPTDYRRSNLANAGFNPAFRHHEPKGAPPGRGRNINHGQ